MRKIALLSTLLVVLAGYVCLQPVAPSPDLATYLPGGALLYLESPDFGRLLHDWNESQVKKDWLGSANYDVFSRSELFSKLGEVYQQYGAAAGFAADLDNIGPLAGTESALALYNIHEVEFLYVTRLAEASLTKSALWGVRDKFEQRQAGGVDFYLRSDAASRRTVAFAFTKGWLLVATRDDLVAQALELMAGGHNPSIASERWSQAVTAQAPNHGDLRLVMNLELLVKSDYFRSYWIQRNASTVRRYWTGVADVQRSPAAITETRVFLRTNDASETAPPGGTEAIPGLLLLVPPEVGMYRIEPVTDASATANLVVNKLIASLPAGVNTGRFAPWAAAPDTHAGSEADLETRIDEQPLPPDAGLADSVAVMRGLLEKGGAQTVLWMQSTSTVAGTFFEMPATIVVAANAEWNRDAARAALAEAAGKVWTTSRLGAGWTPASAGPHMVDQLNGLGRLMFAIHGRLLLLSNDATMLGAALDRANLPPRTADLTYAAGFRHLRERPAYERIMEALDFGAAHTGGGFDNIASAREPAFFSGNLAGLSRTLAKVAEVRVIERQSGTATTQTVIYQLVP